MNPNIFDIALEVLASSNSSRSWRDEVWDLLENDGDRSLCLDHVHLINTASALHVSVEEEIQARITYGNDEHDCNWPFVIICECGMHMVVEKVSDFNIHVTGRAIVIDDMNLWHVIQQSYLGYQLRMKEGSAS